MGHLHVSLAISELLNTAGVSCTVHTDQKDQLEGARGHPVRSLEDAIHGVSARYRLVVLESIPFRRRKLLGDIAGAFRYSGIRLVGHTGWLPQFPTPNTEVNRIRDALEFLGVRAVFLYHGLDVCQGRCHLSQLAPALGIRLFHAGLLLPRLETPNLRQARTLLGVAGGGYGGREIWHLLSQIRHADPSWSIDMYLGPYSPLGPVHAGITTKRCTDQQFASVLSAYSASFSRAGYGACVDHIAAQTPVLFVPLENSDQTANSQWVRPFLAGTVTLSAAAKLIIHHRQEVPRPEAFVPAHVYRILGDYS